MYALNSLILLFISYLHLINYDKEKLEIKQLILIGIVTLIASLTHYYNVIYIGVLYLIFIIKYIKNKQYKNIIVVTRGTKSTLASENGHFFEFQYFHNIYHKQIHLSIGIFQ